ncbi:hypothetical protein BJ912DRAFT_1146652 [Pholiota molesta]|nr:hypothetical protein BJ912DRAFT_1146652 [Pholiota molesta]
MLSRVATPISSFTEFYLSTTVSSPPPSLPCHPRAAAHNTPRNQNATQTGSHGRAAATSVAGSYKDNKQRASRMGGYGHEHGGRRAHGGQTRATVAASTATRVRQGAATHTPPSIRARRLHRHALAVRCIRPEAEAWSEDEPWLGLGMAYGSGSQIATGSLFAYTCPPLRVGGSRFALTSCFALGNSLPGLRPWTPFESAPCASVHSP